jgi:hypothetical protein
LFRGDRRIPGKSDFGIPTVFRRSGAYRHTVPTERSRLCMVMKAEKTGMKGKTVFLSVRCGRSTPVFLI